MARHPAKRIAKLSPVEEIALFYSLLASIQNGTKMLYPKLKDKDKLKQMKLLLLSMLETIESLTSPTKPKV